jgi:uncharacterized SAM-binding protein YcdF (DUF218 family)
LAVAGRPSLTAPASRVLAVLGYSDGSTRELHRIGAARLARAATEAHPDDVVLLTGYARRKGALSEAELMLAAWPSSTGRVICDPYARTTAENAAQIAALVRTTGAREVILVTSRWHARRAAAFVRALLRASDVRVTVVSPDEGDARSIRFLLRELWRWPLMPVQLLLVRRRTF